jgi:hypothetical protein
MNRLNAWLRPNPLTEDPNDRMAVPVTNGSRTAADIVNDLKEEGMEIKTETAVDIITRFNRKVAERVVQGYNVNTGLVYIRSVIKGVFHGRTWDPSLHSVYVAMNQGIEIRRAVAETEVHILGEQSEPIAIYSLTDSTTGATDGSLTKGRNAELKGTYLKIAGDDPAVGITFRNIDTAEVTKLDKADVVLNEPARLLIMVPASLVAGEYEITVTTQFTGGNSVLKQPRSATFGTLALID